MQAGERCVVPDAVHKAVAEVTKKSLVHGGLTAFKYTTKRVPANTDRAIRYLMHVREGSLCEKTVLTKHEVTEEIHTDKEEDQGVQSACAANATLRIWTEKAPPSSKNAY